MPQRRVAITGLGFVTSIGNSRAEVLRSLLELNSGIERHAFLPGTDLAVKVAGTLKGFQTPGTQWASWTWPEGYGFAREALRTLPPHGLYALCAVEQATAHAGLARADVAGDETGLLCASGGSPQLLREHLNLMHDTRGARISPVGIVSSIAGALNFNLGAILGIRGCVGGFASACASSTQALGYAFDEIALGRQRRMLVVGGEDMSFDTLYPFLGMRALSRQTDPDAASRPFDRDRDGFVGTGGAAAIWLEDLDAARERGASVLAEVLGWGQSADGVSMTHPDPDGAGVALAMRRALRNAGVDPSQIGYVNAHATSTPAGDLSEARAILSVFGRGSTAPHVSSTKALTGHGLSVAGAMEVGFCALAIEEEFTPGAAHLVNLDPACEGLNLPRQTLRRAPGVILKNSSGFGGTNVSLVLSRAR